MNAVVAADSAGGVVHEHDWRSASLCRWLASLFAAELNEQQLLAYQRGDAETLLSCFAEYSGLESLVARFRNALPGLLILEHPRLELAADFAGLFLLDGHLGAPPYASLYGAQKQFYQSAQERMQACLSVSGFAVAQVFSEPADHLSIMLEYLAEQLLDLSQLVDALEYREQREVIQNFVRAELLTWLPEFAQRCQQTSTVSDFYAALAELLSGFCLALVEEA